MTAQKGAGPAEPIELASSIDPAFVTTFFVNAAASSRTEARNTLTQLADRIRMTNARCKSQLPWLKLARFGNKRSVEGSLRNDANVVAISGVEADYDGEQITFDMARDLLEKQGIASIIYTSPSHRAEAPRWRVLCPFQEEMPAQCRNHQLGRLNGLFRDVFSNESWTLSQSYYFGSVNRNRLHRVGVVAGIPIDQHDDLDTIWVGKPGASKKAGREVQLGGRNAREDGELIRCIVTGEHLHVELCSLAARYIGRNIPGATVEELLRGIMLSHPECARDERWFDRYYSIPDLVASAFRKYRAGGAEQSRSVASVAFRLLRERRPSAEVQAAALAQAEAVGLPRTEAERIVEWAAWQELARRGAGNAG